MSPLERVFRGKHILVTGHTGFKGGWLCAWLKALGAKVTGLSLPPEGQPNLFHSASVARGMISLFGDIRDFKVVARAMHDHEPEVVFHLAAQALVRHSYQEPLVLGTANILEAVRWTPSVRAVVAITSDKCYENPEDGAPRKESDPMGGHDPYSASKGAAELVIASFRRWFLEDKGIGLASARAGNVIGGGDWALDRIVPDCARALAEGRPVPIRNPRAIRPWQFVLEPASGYLWLAARLLEDPATYSGGWNFGPGDKERVPVAKLVSAVIKAWGASTSRVHYTSSPDAPREAVSLVLSPAKARKQLGWRAAYSVHEAVHETVAWYKASSLPGFDGEKATLEQIRAYTEKARALGLRLAKEEQKEQPKEKKQKKQKKQKR